MTTVHARHRAPTHRRGWLLLAAAATALLVVTGWRVAGAIGDATSDADADPPSAVFAGENTPASATGDSEPEPRTLVSVDDGGDVTVRIDVVFTEPQATLTLWVPERTAGAPAEFAPEVEVRAVRVDGDRQRVEEFLAVGQQLTVELGDPVERVVVEYAATGTWVASEPSTSGRGLVLLTPLRVADPDAASPVAVTDARILNVACADDTGMRTCGVHTRQTWTAERTATEDVIAQVDLAG